MYKYKWTRRKLKYSEYKKNMGLPKDKSSQKKESSIHTITIKEADGSTTKKTIELDEDFLDALHGSKKLSAYSAASDIRKFEIGLFWSRSTFFWAFIAAVYTAYYNVLVNIHKNNHGKLSLLILAALGLFFCVSWLLASYGSKHWQENWENHLDLLEDEITGPLYKTYQAGKGKSVTQITIAAGWAVSVCAYGLLIYEFLTMIKERFSDHFIIPLILTCLFALAVAGMLWLYSNIIIGNTSDSGSVEFDLKEYRNE